MITMEMESQTQTRADDRVDAAAILKKANRPITLKFEDVVYKIKAHEKAAEDKLILKGVTGIVKPGEMLAMLGPSGSGKTTLLTALGGRLGGHLGGSITYNKQPFSNQMKRNMGFVTQDDVLYEHLTVTETLVYTALLRLPNTLTVEQKKAHAEAVISELGLTKCKNSVVGGPYLRGVSGGERKRVSIGQEMLINPTLLFLDEPTSGLDSTTAQMIISTLAELVRAGRTIVMTIHQPSSRLFYMFNKVLLLSEGNPLYFGQGGHVMEYFSSGGFVPLIPMNPTDFLLDLANGVSPDDSVDDPAAVKHELVDLYRRKLADEVKAEIKEFDDAFVEVPVNKKVGMWATTWGEQFSILLRRGIKERRHEAFDALNVIQVIVVAFLAGLLWWHSDPSRLQDRVGLLFFYAGFWGFYPFFQAIFTFPPERMMLAKERSSGMYRLSSYFMARVVSDLPMELILPTAFVLIVYWMTGLEASAISFFYNMFSILLSVLVSQGFGLSLGALVMDQKKATALGGIVMLSFMLTGGFFVQKVPRFVAWIKYLSILQYTYKLLLGSQYKLRDIYPCGQGQVCIVEDFPLVKTVGLGEQYVAAIALFIMFIGYRLIAYLALMRIGATPK